MCGSDSGIWASSWTATGPQYTETSVTTSSWSGPYEGEVDNRVSVGLGRSQFCLVQTRPRPDPQSVLIVFPQQDSGVQTRVFDTSCLEFLTRWAGIITINSLFLLQMAARLPPNQAAIFLSLMTMEGRSFSPTDVMEAVQLNRDFPSALKFLTYSCPICQEQVSFSKVRDVSCDQSETRQPVSSSRSVFPLDHHHDSLGALELTAADFHRLDGLT